MAAEVCRCGGELRMHRGGVVICRDAGMHQAPVRDCAQCRQLVTERS